MHVCKNSEFALTTYPDKIGYMLFWVYASVAFTGYCKLIRFLNNPLTCH